VGTFSKEKRTGKKIPPSVILKALREEPSKINT
jgi:hypothetical protein